MTEIRIADWASERETLLAIRFAVFVHEQGVPPELEEDAQDAEALHLLALSPDGQAIGTGRLLTADGHIGRMAVHRDWRGQGVGSALLHTLLTEAGRAGLRTVFLNAQCTAEPFYRRFGFQPEGEVFDDAGIPHRRMVRMLEDCRFAAGQR